MNDSNDGKTLQKFIFPKDKHQRIQRLTISGIEYK